MIITANSQTLAHEVRMLSKIAAAKSTIPILTHILFRAEDQLYLSATDYEIFMTMSCTATVNEIGEMTLPAKPLLDILDRLPDADVTISDKGVVESGTFKSRLGSLPVRDFPTMPVPPEESIAISAQVLRSLVERAKYAISDKEQKFILRGALLTLTGEVAAMVATDGKRLSIVTGARQPGTDLSVVIPDKTLDVLMDQAPMGEMLFSRSANHLFFNYGRRMLISRVIDGEFPKYQRIIPKENTNVLRVDRGALMASLRRVGIVSETVVMTWSENKIDLTARSQEVGDAAESLAAQYEGKEIRVIVNGKHIIDFLEHATEATTTITGKDNISPLMLQDGADFINVVMVTK